MLHPFIVINDLATMNVMELLSKKMLFLKYVSHNFARIFGILFRGGKIYTYSNTVLHRPVTCYSFHCNAKEVTSFQKFITGFKNMALCT